MTDPTPSRTPSQPSTQPVRVLVVDDHEPFRAALVAMLALDPHYEVVGEAADGESAVVQAAALHPALVLMDVRLPGITGVEATRRIRAAQPGLAVLLMSTHGPADLPDGSDTCGAIAFSRKESVDLELLDRLLAEQARVTPP
jgi:DNA-binding NarL/FixJ family response regulator